jgi:hypothetical protein
LSHGYRAISERYYAIVAHQEGGDERVEKKREREKEREKEKDALSTDQKPHLPAGETRCHNPFLA